MNRFASLDVEVTGLGDQTPREAGWLDPAAVDLGWQHLERRELVRSYAIAGGLGAAFVLIDWLFTRGDAVTEKQSFGMFLFFLVIFGFLLWAISAWLSGWNRRRIHARRWRGGPDDEAQEWDVDIAIVQNWVVTGRDTGKLFIQDRRICFAGRQTSFALAKENVTGSWMVATNKRPLRPLQGADQIQLTRHGDVINWWLEIDYLDRRSNEEFRKRCWKAIGDGLAPRGQFPPTELGPGRQSLAGLWALVPRILVSTGIGTLATLGMFEQCRFLLLSALGFHWHEYWPLELSILLIVWCFAFHSHFRPLLSALRNFRSVIGGYETPETCSRLAMGEAEP